MASTLVVWRFRDGKVGHERQSAGLLEALAHHRPLAVHDFDVATVPQAWWAWLRGRMPGAMATLPTPGLVIGAGSACAWPILAATRASGATSVYLMRPPVPACCFDLCFIPRHDGIAGSERVILTEGVLNDIAPTTGPREGPIPILVGGPSRHHDWDEPGLLLQVASLVNADRDQRYVIADSRRTPASTGEALRKLHDARVQFVSHAECPADWLRETLLHAPAAWVSADSVSMLFEAQSAGCAVGVLEVPARRIDRISRIAQQLEAEGRVRSLKAWLAGDQLSVGHPALAEATRCAALLAARLVS